MDNKILNNIKERLLKENDTRRRNEIAIGNAFANGYVCGVENLVAAAAAEAAEQQAQPTPRTNLDRIRAMSANRIADWAAGCLGCDSCPVTAPCLTDPKGGNECKQHIVAWLNSPAKEDGKNA